jgi:DNA-binding NarL/FixJ family response regulator
VEVGFMATMLIIEDNALIRHSLREIVHKQFPSLIIEEAKDEKEAIKKAQLFCPSLIFMDIKLRDGNGLHITKKIKAQNPTTIIAVITNYDLPEYREAAIEWGASYFLSKNVSTREEIVRVVNSVISKKE